MFSFGVASTRPAEAQTVYRSRGTEIPQKNTGSRPGISGGSRRRSRGGDGGLELQHGHPENITGVLAENDAISGPVTMVVTAATFDPFLGMVSGILVRLVSGVI